MGDQRDADYSNRLVAWRVGKDCRDCGTINFGLGLAVVPVMILDRLSMTYKRTLSRRDPSLPEL